jgi:hypothetical protein
VCIPLLHDRFRRATCMCCAQELGIRLSVERVVLLLHSSNMFSQLDATARVSAITACIEHGVTASSTKAAEAAPLLDVKGFSAAAALAVYW